MSDDTDSRRTRGLGLGLSALLGEVEPDSMGGAARGGGPPASSEIAIDLIRRNPTQPRRVFGQSELEALADSIRQHGVVQPVLLRPDPASPGRYELVAGERRWRAAQMAGLHSVPALVRELDDLATLEVSIVENLQRTDLDPIDEALSFQQLMDRFGRTQQSVADAVGKSRAHVANMLRLLGLPDRVKDLVRSGALTAGHARAVLSADDPEAVARDIVARGLSVRDAERLAAGRPATPRGSGSTGRHDEADSDTRALSADLTAALGLDVTVRHDGQKGGSVSISYKTLEQLDDLCRRLSAPHR